MKYASVSNLRMLENEVRGSFVKVDQNSMLLQEKIVEIREIILKITESLSRNNPFLIGDILEEEMYAQYNGRTLEISPCKICTREDCEMNNKLYGGSNECEPISSTQNVSEIYFFKRDEKIEEFVPDKLGKMGVGKTIAESILEEQLMDRHSDLHTSESHNIFESIGSWMGYGSFYQLFVSVLPTVNFILIIYLGLRK